MGIPILARQHLYIEKGPRTLPSLYRSKLECIYLQCVTSALECAPSMLDEYWLYAFVWAEVRWSAGAII